MKGVWTGWFELVVDWSVCEHSVDREGTYAACHRAFPHRLWLCVKTLAAELALYFPLLLYSSSPSEYCRQIALRPVLPASPPCHLASPPPFLDPSLAAPQIHRLNSDATQLNTLKHQVRALEATGHQQQQQQQRGGAVSGAFSYGEEDDDIGGGGGPGMVSAEASGARMVSPRGAPRGGLVPPYGGGGASLPSRVDNLSAMRASLEQISRVVNGALTATQQQQQQQMAGRSQQQQQQAGGGGGGMYGDRRGGPTGSYSSSSLLDGLMYPQRQQPQQHHMRAADRSHRAPAAMAWGSEYDELDDGASLMSGAAGNGGDLSFLGRWKDEHDVAQALLQEHSSWLRGFREQVGRASTVSGGGGNGATMRSAVSAAGGGGGLPAGNGGSFAGLMQRTSAPSAPQMMTSRTGGPSSGGSGGVPMRIPIGNNQEVVVTVQHQQ